MNLVVNVTISSPMVTSNSLIHYVPLKWHRKYPVFVRLMRNPLPPKTALYFSNLLLTSSLDSTTNMLSSANKMPYGTIFQIDLEISTIGLSVNPWCRPTLTRNDSIIPPVFMLINTLLYMSCITLMYLYETPLVLRLS